jgi:hypothetical protein
MSVSGDVSLLLCRGPSEDLESWLLSSSVTCSCGISALVNGNGGSRTGGANAEESNVEVRL